MSDAAGLVVANPDLASVRFVHKHPLIPGTSLLVGGNPVVRHVGDDPQLRREGVPRVPLIWVEQDHPRLGRSHFVVYVIGTGDPIPDNATYEGTAVMLDGFVWHVYTPSKS